MSEGELVGSGSFKVDRKYALARLSELQIPNPQEYLLHWVRAAVAGGATGVEVDRTLRRIEVSFDGPPLAREVLEDPFACLFEEGRAGAGGAWFLAYGILAALRTSPRAVEIDSGRGAARLRWRTESLGREKLEALADGGERTVLRIRVPLTCGRFTWDQPIVVLQAHCRQAPIPVKICGKVFGQETILAPEGLAFREGAVYGWIGERPTGATTISVLRYGVHACWGAMPLPEVQVWGFINDDRLALDAALGSVVKDENYQAAVRLLTAQANRLLLEVAERQRARLPAIAAALRAPGDIRCWRLGIEGKALLGNEGERLREWFRRAGERLLLRDPRVRRDRERSIWNAGFTTKWLREAALRLLPGAPAPGAALEPLYDAPIVIRTDGGVWSLRELDALAAGGKLTAGTGPAPEKPPAVWCMSEAERVTLNRRVPLR